MPFRLFIGAMWIGLALFTAFVIARDGLVLFPIFFGAIRDGHWPGQFNADFMTFLALSGFWTAWRSDFAPSGLLLGLVALFMGGGFLLAYLLYLAIVHRNDAAKILLGVHAKRV